MNSEVPHTVTSPRPQREPVVAPGGIELFAADMTATIAADVPLAEVQRRLAEVGQWLPVDTDRADAAVGELVARNSTGPLRLGYGGWRDLLLGCQFLNGRDELITAGGRAVKNVAGYDLTKFMVGQHGIFGKLVTLTTRTYRRPAFGLVATFEPKVEKLGALLPTACRPQWATLDARSLTCGYLGDERTAGFIESSIGAYAPRGVQPVAPFTGEGSHVPRFAPRSRGEYFRASVPPAAIVEFAQAAGARDWIADPAFGIVLGNFDGDGGRDAVHNAAAAMRGQVTFYDANGTFSFAPATSEERLLLQRLKTAFDPEGRLRPLPFA